MTTPLRPPSQAHPRRRARPKDETTQPELWGMLRDDGSRSIQNRFEWFIAQNPQVYTEFKRLSQQLWDAGWRHYSAGAVVEHMRFSRALHGVKDAAGFRINNNFRSRLVRKLIAEDQRWSAFYETRELKTA